MLRLIISLKRSLRLLVLYEVHCIFRRKGCLGETTIPHTTGVGQALIFSLMVRL